MVFKRISGVKVEVDDVSYMPTLQAPINKPHPFIYFITLQNDSKETIQILGRKWIVEESDGEIIVVEGDGVIGQAPILPPGENFSYNSYHVVAKNAVVLGAFYGLSESGKKFMVDVPPFKLRVPKY